MPFALEFFTGEDVIKELRAAVVRGDNAAILLWPTEQFGIPEEAPGLEAYLDEEGLTVYGLKNSWSEIQEEIYTNLVSPEILKRIKDFENHPRQTEGNNGKLIESEVFATILDGLRLQIIHLEEWWQAFGGAHIGDNKRIWLMHREPLKTK
jgi:hypothetical protein